MLASGGPGSAKNDPQSAKVTRKWQKSKKWANLTNLRRIAAKPSSQRWSTFWKENQQKLAFREGVQPWDLASFSGRIESYRFIMESSKSKPYSASYSFVAGGKLAVALSTSWPTSLATWLSIFIYILPSDVVSGFIQKGGWGSRPGGIGERLFIQKN